MPPKRFFTSSSINIASQSQAASILQAVSTAQQHPQHHHHQNDNVGCRTAATPSAAAPTTAAAELSNSRCHPNFGNQKSQPGGILIQGPLQTEAARIREEPVAAYSANKSKEPALIAKSSVLRDVKPSDNETDIKEMEKCVRTIEMDGLLWGASKLVPVGYGINKLQIILQEKMQEFENFVQSVDIAAFNKIYTQKSANVIKLDLEST